MTRQNVQIFLVAVVLIGAAGMAAAQTGELVRTISMEPGGRFSLGNIDGEITVTGVDGDDLTIRATKRVAGRGSAGRLASLARLIEVKAFSGDLDLTDVRSDEGPDRRDRQRAHRYRGSPGAAAAGEVLRRRGGAARGRGPARRGGDGIRIGDLRRCAGSRRPVRIAVALGPHPPDAAGRLGIRAGRAVLQRRPAFRHSHPRRPGRPVPPRARLRGRAPRDSRDCCRWRRPPRAVHRQRRHGDRYTRFDPAAPAASRPSGSIDIR